MKALATIPDVGKSIAEQIGELLTTGTSRYHQELHARTPVDVTALTAIEGVGPKAVKVLYDALGVTDLASLEAAARAGRIRDLPRFGEKSEEKILRGPRVREADARGASRWERCCRWCATSKRASRRSPASRASTIAGSIRRRKETVGDADLAGHRPQSRRR